MKNKLIKFVSMLLTVAIMSQAICLDVFAADSGYICDMRLSWSKESADKAKQWLWDNGYDVIDYDLNGDTNGRPWVYLGYKTTDNPDEAITDVKIMNMNGGFITFDTQEQLRDMYSDLFAGGEKLMIILEELRKNYSEGSIYTSTTVDMLNMFYLDDKDLGDFLMEDAELEDMIDLRYFSATMPSQVLVALMAMGLRGGGDNDAFWVDKLAQNLSAMPMTLETENPDENLDENLDNLDEEENLDENQGENLGEEENQDENLDESQDEIVPEETAEETTEDILKTIQDNTSDDILKAIPDEATLEAELEVNFDSGREISQYQQRDYDKAYDIYDVVQILQELYDEFQSSNGDDEYYEALFKTMYETQLGETNLFDYLMAIESPEDAVALAASLTDGQIAMAGQQGADFFAAANLSEDDLSGMLSDANDVGERAYFWEGRDEIDYDSGFAMTMDALSNMDLSETGIDKSTVYEFFAVTLGVISVVALAFTIYYLVQFIRASLAFKQFGSASFIVLGLASRLTVAGEASFLTAKFGINPLTMVTFVKGGFTLGLVISAVVFIVTIIASIYLFYKSVTDFYNPDLIDIPHTIAEMFTSREGFSSLVYYKAVLDDEGKAGDLNAWTGNSWNALYTTKDTKVGNPIKANMLVQTGNPDAPYGYLPVSAFGKVVAMNTNIGAYSTTKHFLFFKNNDPHFTGSVFGGANGNLIFGGTGLIVGAACGVIGMNFATKHRRKLV